MSEVVTGVVKLTFGILANKIRTGIAERLKDGDVTDEECRRLIVRELDDVKGKLDGLARKDLLSSLCFLQEGINGLYQSLLQLDSDSNTTESTGQATLVETASSRDTGFESAVNEAIVPINAITSLKIRSNDRFKSAMKSFELARKKATEAFCNEALSIEDRIQASQIRMMARILEKLEDPDASVSDCLQYLKQLHDIGAIQEIFSVLIDGGIKSRFNKTKRLDNASSVHLMNQILFQFSRKFTKLPPRLFDWPMILFGKKSYHPVFGDYSFIHKLEDSGVQGMSPDFTFGEEIWLDYSAVNSEGDIVALTKYERTFKIFKRSGESRTLCEVPREEHASVCYAKAIDIDAEDNIYVITAFQKSDDQLLSLKLFIFDKNGNKKLESLLPFHIRSDYSSKVIMAINKDGRIAILNLEKNTLYIGNACVKLNSFQVEKKFSLNEVLNNFSVVLASFDGTKVVAAANKYSGSRVYIYTENGQLQSKIKIPEGHRFIESVAINHATKRILVKTLVPISLLSVSSTGELINSFSLGLSEWTREARLTSHPNGPVALVGETGASLIQL